jgi:hypothetical protein
VRLGSTFRLRQIAAFERSWNHDAHYIREMIDANPRATTVLRSLA